MSYLMSFDSYLLNIFSSFDMTNGPLCIHYNLDRGKAVLHYITDNPIVRETDKY